MSQSFTTANLQALLAYPFRDPEWKKKFLLGSLITVAGFIIPIVPFAFIYGYMAQIMRRIIVDKGEPFLPEWKEWEKLLVDGFKILGAILIYTFPLMIIFMIGYMLMVFVPMMMGIPLTAAAEYGQEAGGAMLGVMTVISVLGGVLLFGLGFLLSLAIGIVMPALIGHVVATDQFSAAFRLREWWAIFRANLRGFLLAYLIIWVISMALSSVYMVLYCTVILCCLMPFVMGPTTMYLLTIYGAIFGRAYREAVEKLAGMTQA